MHSLTCVSAVVCVARKPCPCLSYSRRKDRINSVLLCSYYKGGGRTFLCDTSPSCASAPPPDLPVPVAESTPHTWGHTFVYLPLDYSGRQLFWRVWKTEWVRRRTIVMTPPMSKNCLVASSRSCKAVLTLAPPWLRQLAELIHWPTADKLLTIRQWVSAVWTVLDPWSVADRVVDEINGAKSWKNVYQGKATRCPLHTRALHALGPWNLNAVPLLPTHIHNTDSTEARFIQNVTPNFNDQRCHRKPYRK